MKKKFRCIGGLLSALIFMLAAVPTAAFPVTAEEAAIDISEESASAQAGETSGTCGENLTWRLDVDTGAMYISGTGEMDNWYYSYYYESLSPWYDLSAQIRTVVVESGVTSIGDYAFYTCTNLTSVALPDSVTSIGYSAFLGCTQLESATLPEHLSHIESYAFYGCASLTETHIPDEVTSIEDYAFYGCTSLSKVTLPDGLASIGQSAFRECTSLATLTIPESTADIGGRAFYNTPWLEAKQAKNPIVVINGIVIDGRTCSGEVVLPDDVTCIADYAFYLCTDLTSVTIPNGVTRIGNFAFNYCTLLTGITLPDSVVDIGRYAFDGCTNLASITIRNPYCRIYDEENTLPDTTKIYGYENSFAAHYAESYARTFSVLAGEPTVQYTYEITPLIAPFNNYFFIQTDNPDPTSFRFVDVDSVYSEEATLTWHRTSFADVEYDDAQTLRVNGGYIFYSGSTDGGQLMLQCENANDTWVDFGLTITLPTLCDQADYLIQTYATSSDFFENMDAVQAGFSSICLYSGSYIRGSVYRSDDFWSVSTSPHIDQYFYIYSPYDRRDNQSLFASAIYPFRYDSLGFPSIMARVSQRLDSTSSYTWSSTSHAYIEVTYGGETHTYGGAGNGEGQGLTPDKISRIFTFSETDQTFTLEEIHQLLLAYAAVEMEDDIPRTDALTWTDITETVGEGAWARVGGGYTYLYKRNDRNSYSAEEWGVGNSIYWGGSLGFGSDTWVDGRYINTHERYVAGETLEDHPQSDIILFQITLPVVSYDSSYQYSSETGQYEYTYENISVEEITQNVRYIYDETEDIWKANRDATSIMGCSYNTLAAMTEKGLIDAKYLDAVQLTHEEVASLEVDRNTNVAPTEYYLYDGSAAPGTLISATDTPSTTTTTATESTTTTTTTTIETTTEPITESTAMTTTTDLTTATIATETTTTNNSTTESTATTVTSTESATTAATTETTTETIPEYTLGDLDDNGVIDTIDAFYTLIAYASVSAGRDDGLTDAQRMAADVDRDGWISTTDAYKILIYYATMSAGGTPSWD